MTRIISCYSADFRIRPNKQSIYRTSGYMIAKILFGIIQPYLQPPGNPMLDPRFRSTLMNQGL